MKRLYKHFFLLAISLILLISCNDDLSKKEWGHAKIYIPQASILNGGISNDYPVSLKNNPATNNFRWNKKTNVLEVVLGVYRSGLESLKAFSVTVSTNTTATHETVSKTNKGYALPKDTYSLPSKVDVKDGERQAIFYLSVDLNKIIANYPYLATRKLCLTVEISNPTFYELNSKLSKVNVVIDGSAFLPAPKIVKGGDMGKESMAYWTVIRLSKPNPVFTNAVTFEDGYLKLTYGNEPTEANTAIFQEIELEGGKEYKISADFTTSGGASNSEIFILISDKKPKEGEYYQKSGVFAHSDTWGGRLINPYIGDFIGEANWKEGIGDNGVFKAPFNGKGYLNIIFASWTGHIGTLTLDNIDIQSIE